MVSRSNQFEKSSQKSQLESGKIQLWQFLLEILTDKNLRHVIQWIGNDGEFRLVQPQVVAKAWGERKNNPRMTHEKFARAIRNYYGGEFLERVDQKKNSYKFVCDLKLLVGYTFQELNELVNGL